MKVLGLNQYIVEKTTKDFIKKPNKWTKVNVQQFDDEVEAELFNLISLAYAPIGGNKKVKQPKDVSDPQYKYFKMIDLDDDLHADLIIFGKKTKYGIKFSEVGHSGTKQAKQEYIKNRQADLKKSGFYGEVSGKLSSILINKFNVPFVTDPAEIKKVLQKDIKFYGEHPKDPASPGNGWYSRKINGSETFKILVGKPK